MTRCLLAAATLGLACAAAPGLAETAVTVTLGFGPQVKPAYFGSDDYRTFPAGSVQVDLSAGPLGFGAAVPGSAGGWVLRGAFAVTPARRAADHGELAGLKDIDTAVEVGLGLGYEAANWRAFADLRAGVAGHSSTVAVLGLDAKFRPTERLTVSFGPRATFASDGYLDTYFGVGPDESAASGLAAYDPEGGLVSTGAELRAAYDFGNDWGLEGRLRYDRFRGDAADSPIVEQGEDGGASVSVMLTRRFSFGF